MQMRYLSSRTVVLLCNHNARFSTWFILLCHFFTHPITHYSCGTTLHAGCDFSIRKSIPLHTKKTIEKWHRTNSLSSWCDFLRFWWNILITNETFIWTEEDKRISAYLFTLYICYQTVEKKTVLVSSKCNRFIILIILMYYITLDCLKVKSICVTLSWYWNFRKCECISSVQNQLWFSSKISISFN